MTGDSGLSAWGTGSDEEGTTDAHPTRTVIDETATDDRRTGRTIPDGGIDPAFADRTLDAAPIGIVVTDPSMEDNPIVYANEGFRRLTGYGDEEIIGRNCRFLQGEGTDPEPVSELRAAIEAAEPVTVELRNYRHDGSAFWNRVSITPLFDDDGDLTYFVGCQEDVTGRVERERMLSGLHAAVPSFMRAESVRAVSDLAVETLLSVSELSVASVYRLDERSNGPRPLAHDTARGTAAEEPVDLADPDDPIRAGSADDEAGGSSRVASVEADGRDGRRLTVPVGDHGLLVAGKPGAVSAVDREFVELLAATVEAAFDRLDREAELERRNDRLAELSRINTVIRGVIRSVVAAETRSEIERAVCERFAATTPFTAALVAVYRDHAGEVLVSEAVGIDTPVRHPTADTDDPWVDAAVRATGNRTVETVEREGSGASRSWAVAAAVPITAGGTTYGVLVVFTAAAEPFDAESRAVLSELGETVGLAIRDLESRRGLLAETVVEIAVEIDGADSPLGAASDRLGCRLSVDGFVPIESNRVLYSVTASGVSMDALTALLEDLGRTGEWELVTGTDDRGVFVADTHLSRLVGLLLDHGGVPHSAVATDGRLRLVAHVPPETDHARLFDGIETVSPSVTLVGKREVERPSRSVREGREAFTDRLTDRQLSVLRAAYHAGYFEWPRESTAEELADSMRISSSTLHFHLRRALAKLLAELLDRPEHGDSR